MKRVKRDYSLLFLCTLAVVLSCVMLITIPLANVNQTEVLTALLGTTAIMYLHEVVHYSVIRYAFKKSARITTLLRRGALMVEYDRLSSREYIAVSLAPLVFIQLPLTVATLVVGSPAIAIPTVLHGAGSIADVFYALRIAVTCRGCTVGLYRENGKVKGYVIVKPGGEETIYIV